MDHTAEDARWKRPYTELIYQPMLEVMQYFRENGYRTYIVTGGGQDFVRAYSQEVYGIPPEQVVGTAGERRTYDKNGKPILTKDPKLLLNDNEAGKPEGIHLMIGRRPYAAFGNSTGDPKCSSTREAGDGAHLKCLSSTTTRRAICLRPRQWFAGYHGRHLYRGSMDEAKKGEWTVISMKNDWKRIFGFEQSAPYRLVRNPQGIFDLSAMSALVEKRTSMCGIGHVCFTLESLHVEHWH